MAATLIYLKLVDASGREVKGESTAKKYLGQIELESFSWEAEAGQSKQVGQKTSEQVKYQHLRVSKFFDRSSPVLCQMMVGRGPDQPIHFKSALVSFVDAVGEPNEKDGMLGLPVLEILLTDGYVQDVTLAASSGGKAIQLRETVELAFRQIKLTYFLGGDNKTTRGKGFDFEAVAASVEK